MKVIPVYLPQFHPIPENDKWWGKGFTEWVNVKNARPLFDGHNQPRIPFENNYYNLADVNTLKWQCEIARKYGIYGFCMYHYWFSGKVLLHKPMEILLEHPEIDINYCISWANGEWRDTWKKRDSNRTKILIFDDYNNERLWVDHFNYMLPFFRDKRYMKENNKPILVIYTPHLIPKLNKMLDLWTNMAIQNGLNGLVYIFQSAASNFDNTWDRSRFSYGVEMNPGYVRGLHMSKSSNIYHHIVKIAGRLKRMLHIKHSLYVPHNKTAVVRCDYDSLWQETLRLRPTGPTPMIPCAFTDWDNTPRFGINGWAIDDVSPAKFKKYFSILLHNAKKFYHSDMVFVFAWNEWAEGGYLEPDELYGYGFLEAIKDALNEYENF